MSCSACEPVRAHLSGTDKPDEDEDDRLPRVVVCLDLRVNVHAAARFLEH